MYQINSKGGLKAALLLGAAGAATLGLTATAYADVETVVVTGSRIPQRGLEGASPVTTISPQEIQYQGSTSLSETFQELPSVVNDGDSESVDNGTAGICTVDLRNLGAKRTLILVDGKRLVSSDASLDVDICAIPVGMVQSVEVLTGGDSAVYGADAVSGVVNIKLKHDFEGMYADTQFGQTDSGDGTKTDSYAMMGFNSGDGKGNVTIYGEYEHRDSVPESARPYGVHALAATNYTGCAPGTNTHFGGFCYSGSSTIPDGRIKSGALGGTTGGLKLAGGFPNAVSKCKSTVKQTTIYPLGVACNTMFTSSGKLIQYDGRTFNFMPYQYYQTQGQRYSFGAEGHYEVNKYVDIYTRLTFADNQSTSQLGPSPMTTNFNINCGNPLMSAEERQIIFGTTNTVGTISAQCGTVDPSVVAANPGVPNPRNYVRLVSTALRLTAVGPRISYNEHELYQMVLGVRGDTGFLDFTYDISAQYGHVLQASQSSNDASKTNFQNGLLVNTSGKCFAGGSCVPLNFFHSGGINPAQAAYIRENLVEFATVDQWDIQATAVGTLGAWGFQSPWAKDPVGVAIGTEYRQEAAATHPDQNLATGNLVGFESIVPTSGNFSVGEGYIEVNVPVVQDHPFFKDLSLHGAFRYSGYDIAAGDTETWRAQASWAPVDDFRIRASLDRAVRSPNVAELFTPAGGSSANSGSDPCSAHPGSVVTTALLCYQTGVPAGQAFSATLNCPTNQCQAAVGGNPLLKPEVATTREIGIVLTPTFIDGFTLTLDYYNIDISGFIESTPISTILANCYSTAAGFNPTQNPANPFCGFVHRDALGQIDTQNAGYVVAAEGNLGRDHVQGLDLETNYTTDMDDWGLGLKGWGGLNFHYIATLVTQNNTEVTSGDPASTLHCAGVYGANCGEPENRFKGNLRTTWTDAAGDISISLQWRYLSGVRFEQDQFPNPGICGGKFGCFTNSPSLNFPDFNYFDLSGTWNITESLSVRAGVRNILDKSPPLTDNNIAPVSDVNGNTFPNTYDALGRVWFIGGGIKF